MKTTINILSPLELNTCRNHFSSEKKLIDTGRKSRVSNTISIEVTLYVILLVKIIIGTKYAEQISQVTKQEFQQFVKDVFYNAPRKFEVHVISELMKDDNLKHKAENKEKINFVSSEDAFRKKMTLYPDFHSSSKV